MFRIPVSCAGGGEAERRAAAARARCSPRLRSNRDLSAEVLRTQRLLAMQHSSDDVHELLYLRALLKMLEMSCGRLCQLLLRQANRVGSIAKGRSFFLGSAME